MKKRTQREILRQREVHLNKIAKFLGGWAKEVDVMSVWTSLRRYECKMHRFSEMACGDGSINQERKIAYAERQLELLAYRVTKKLRKLFKNTKKFDKLFYINYDHRGYVLKLCAPYKDDKTYNAIRKSGIVADWGTNIILAPDEFGYYQYCNEI